MKFSIAAITGFVSAITAASLPNAFTLVAEGGKTVLTDGQKAYVGEDATAREILILRGGSPNGLVTYTAKGSVPTAFQNLYVIENDVSPVGLTVPHSGAVPEGGNLTGFGINEEGLFTHGGKAWFAVDGYSDDPAKEIVWYAGHNAEYRGEKLYVHELKNYSA